MQLARRDSEVSPVDVFAEVSKPKYQVKVIVCLCGVFETSELPGEELASCWLCRVFVKEVWVERSNLTKALTGASWLVQVLAFAQ